MIMSIISPSAVKGSKGLPSGYFIAFKGFA
jgi:hypothetical protein